METVFEKKFKEEVGEDFSADEIWDNSIFLAIYCSSYFTEWWDPEEFDWYDSEYLSQYCSNHVQWKLDGYKMGKVGIEVFSPDEIVKYL